MSPVQEAAYVSVKLLCKSCRPDSRSSRKNTDATPEQEREQKQIIRFPEFAGYRRFQRCVSAE